MEIEKRYFKRLDILRIVACILILLYHLHIIEGGFLAVCTFFTLYGYLGCLSSLKCNNFSIRNYYKNRIKKIYIPLLIVISLTVITYRLFSYNNWLNLKQETISSIFGYNNFWQLNINLDYFTKNVHSPLIHLWYISILMQFDLIFPFVFKLLKKVDEKINKHISTIIVFILALSTTIIFIYMSKTNELMTVYYNSIARSFSILWGIFLALIHYKYSNKLSLILKEFNAFIYILYLLLLIVICSFIKNTTNYYVIYMLLVTFISLRLIKYSTIVNSNKNNKILSFISRCTYEIYLVQYPIIFFTQNTSFNKIVIIFLLTIIIAVIIYILINIKLKNIILKIIRVLIICIIICGGFYVVIIEPDHLIEMKELENKLDENLKLIEEKNKEYLNNIEKEEKELKELLENLDSEGEKTITKKLSELPVVGIGDSVLLGAVNELYNKFPNGYFDGKVSRSIPGGKEVLLDLKNNNKLSSTVILALANNGDYSTKRNKDLMSILEDREVFWINAMGADDPTFNEKFKEFAKDYSNLHIIDWESVAKEHPEYLYGDGVHTKGAGMKAYANLVYETIYNYYLDKYKSDKDDDIKKKENELKNKIAFYGNDLLTNLFDDLHDKFINASFNAKEEFDIDSFYNELKEKINDNILEQKIVLLYDKEANISEEDYKKIIELCKERKLYIVNIIDRKLSFKGNVKIINFYDDIKDNDDYMMADKIHLSKKGNKELSNKLINIIKD